MTPSGIEPATFRFVALCHRGLQKYIDLTNNNIPKTINNGLDAACYNEVTKECLTDTGIHEWS
jgi:hypothetical protein